MVNKPSSSGFTLLELAVAAALGVILLAAAAVLGVRGMTAWRSMDNRLQVLFRLEKGLSWLEEDLRNGVAAAEVPFHGLKEEIGFAVAEDSLRLAQVRYRIEKDSLGHPAWVREWLPFPNREPAELQVTTLVAGITGFSVQYGAVSEEEGQRTLRWVAQWNDLQKQIPKMVRVHLEGVYGRSREVSVTRDLWIPNGAWVTLPNE